MAANLNGKVAMVTGASRGIGRAIALAMADAGASVIVASRKQEGVEAVAQEIRLRNGTALPVVAHVGQEEAVAGLVQAALDAFGSIHILVNNAATNPHFGPMLTASPAQWDKILEVNLRGAFLLIQRVVPVMQAAGGGKIINLASVAGMRPSPGMGIYSVSKAGLLMLTRALAVELGPWNIQVNAIAPGLIKTRLSSALWESPEIADRVTGSTPLGRLGEAGDVVGAALFLASSDSDYMTGATLVVDGGISQVSALG